MFVYILKSLKDLKTYTGFSLDIEKRIKEHNQGKVDATKHRRPFVLLYKENCSDLKEAKKREKYWKSGAGRRKLKQFFKNGFPLIQNE
ncbi:MAG: GIY-YIG nuclease family protein [Patescibacteria group bacterium]